MMTKLLVQCTTPKPHCVVTDYCYCIRWDFIVENVISHKTDHFLRSSCFLHFDALVATGSFDCTGRMENEQESLPTIDSKINDKKVLYD
jgi:hypothetical protein